MLVIWAILILFETVIILSNIIQVHIPDQGKQETVIETPSIQD